MARFHYSQQAGEARRCYAKVGNCPLGGESLHFDGGEAEARQWAEEKNSEYFSGNLANTTHKKSLSNKEFEALSLLQKAEHQHRTLQDAIENRKKPSQKELVQHRMFVAEQIGQAIEDGQLTHLLHTEKDSDGNPLVDDNGNYVYTKDRQKEHNEIIGKFVQRYEKTPRERKALASGGLSGAGKTSVLKKKEDVDPEDPSQWAILNPDPVKEEMAERKLFPIYKGTTQMDMQTLGHVEAEQITLQIQSKLMSQGTNVVFDRTFSSIPRMEKELENAKQQGYTIRGVFIDVTVDTSDTRAEERYDRKMQKYLTSGGKDGNGSRFISASVNASSAPREGSDHNSKNAENFQTLYESGVITDFVAYDNNRWGAEPAEIPKEKFLSRKKQA